VIITLVGWLSIVRGTVRIVFTPYVIKTAPKIIKKQGLLTGVSLVLLILGAVLSYFGYAVR
jgi:hypothetical protein